MRPWALIPRRSFRQKFLPFSGRAALPVLGRKPTFCRGNVFVAANFPFQESSERLHIFYIEQLNLFMVCRCIGHFCLEWSPQ